MLTSRPSHPPQPTPAPLCRKESSHKMSRWFRAVYKTVWLQWQKCLLKMYVPMKYIHLDSISSAYFSLVQFGHSVLSNSLRPPWTVTRQASLSITNSRSLLKLMSINSVMLSSHPILCRPLLLLPSVFPRSASFPMSHFFTSGGQSIGVSASASVLPTNIQD